jgi:hypothetical protein
LATLNRLKSVDVVITPDKSKWTRCPVIEMQPDTLLSQGNVRKNHLRKAPSVDKNGNPDGSGEGMGWFPGYAICLETGERLNMAFGEDSWLAAENGRDMIWNPTSNLYSGVGSTSAQLGGKHFIYVFDNNTDHGAVPVDNRIPAYDEGQKLRSMLRTGTTSTLIHAWRACLWVGFPLLEEGQQLLSNEAKIRLRVQTEYNSYHTGSFRNNDFPMYNFNMFSIGTGISSNVVDNQNQLTIFPNPFSTHTEIRFNNDNNDPHTIEIFSISGALVRKEENISGNNFIINRGNLRPGVYFVKLVNNKKSAITSIKKVVVL